MADMERGSDKVTGREGLPENGFECELRTGQKNVAVHASDSEKPGGHTNGEGGGVDLGDSVPLTAAILSDLVEMTRHHRRLVKTKNKLTNAISAFEKSAAAFRIRSEGGEMPKGKWPTPNDADRQAVRETYPELFAAVELLEKGLPVEKAKIGGLNFYRREIEKAVQKLPIKEWIDSVPGLGYAAAGYLLGITGDPAKYPHPRMMVKRLGVAPKDAYFSEQYGKNLVPRETRAITLYWCVDSLIKKQNKYRDVYLNEKRRLVALHPDWAKANYDPKTATGTTKNADGRAYLRAATVLIYDLWAVWNGESTSESDSDTAFEPPAFLAGQKRESEYSVGRTIE